MSDQKIEPSPEAEEMPDLAKAFQDVVSQTITANLTSIAEQVPGINPDDLLRCAMMGAAGAVAVFWHAKAKIEGELDEAREALHAVMDNAWDQLEDAPEGDEDGDKMSLDAPPT